MFACWARHHNHASLVALHCIAMDTELQAWLTRHGVPETATWLPKALYDRVAPDVLAEVLVAKREVPS